MEELVEKYQTEHEVIYEMRAIVDGETVVKYQSPIDFSDVSGYAYLADQAMQNHVVEHYQSESEYELEKQLDNFRDERAY